jgi:hypothetical protein
MTEQYEDPADGFFEAPAPAPTDRKEQRPGGSDTGTERIPLADIKVRVSTDSTPDDDVVLDRPEPKGAHRLSKGMVLNRNVLENPLGGGKSTDVWQASHPEHGPTLVKVVGEISYPKLDKKRLDPDAFEALENAFLEFETFHQLVIDTLAPQAPGDGALLKLLDMGRTKEGRIFKVARFLSHEVMSAGGLLGRRSKDALEPAPSIGKVKAHRWDPEQKMRLVRSVLLSLWQLHKHDIVHGDIKPNNILAVNTPTGYVARLIDYDNCFFSGNPFDATLIGGDEPFFSPERAAYEVGDLGDVSRLTTASDLFSLSLVLHQVLSEGASLPRWSIKRGSAAESCSDGGTPICMPLGTGNSRLEEMLEDCLRLDSDSRPSTYSLLVASGVYLERRT